MSEHRIHRLATHTANQIAAGEVVERPASVIKECVENSIDAGAKNIRIEIELGGAQLIRITDDGSGIHQDDLQLAVSRHATSKITSVEDLQTISSLGFRGEALASIASVSHFTLTSRTAASDCAWQIKVDELAQCSQPKPAAHPRGTTIEIRSLFYNTPARRKFLRSERTEAVQIQEIVKRLALSNFHVAMSLQMDERMVYQCFAVSEEAAFVKRVKQLCGKAFVDNAIAIDLAAPGLRLWGWLGLPEYTRSQNDGQYFFVNGRVIRDKLINHALREAYQEVIYPGRYPLYLLYLECEPNDVDVNVHPTKHEVRFHNARLIHDFITSKLTPIILNQPQSPSMLDASDIENDIESVTMIPGARSARPMPANQHEPLFRPAAFNYPSRTPSEDTATHVRYHDKVITPQKVIDNRYGVILQENALLLVDCVALNTIALTLKCQNPETLQPQPLLIPERVTLSENIILSLREQKDKLMSVGIDIQFIDSHFCLVKQWPKGLPCLELNACLTRFAESSNNLLSALVDLATFVNYTHYTTQEWSALWAAVQWDPNQGNNGMYPQMIRTLGTHEISRLLQDCREPFSSSVPAV